MKIQQPGKSTPVNSNRQLDKKEFYQAIQKYGETSKADASAGNVAQYIVNNQGTITASEATTLSAQLNADGITATPTGPTCGSLHTAGTWCVLGTGNNLASVDTSLYLKGAGQTATTNANTGNFQTTCCAPSTGIVNIFNDSSCKALYTFDNNSNDISSNAYNGTDTTVNYTSSGKFGNSLNFNNSTSSSATTYSELTLANNWTVSFWTKWNGSTTNYYSPISGGDLMLQWSNTVTYILIPPTTGTQNPVNYIDLAISDTANNTKLRDNAWHLVTITHIAASTNFTYYIDGIQGSAARSVGGASGRTANLVFGNFSSGINSSNTANVDQTRIFNRVLTTNEITALYNEH